MESGCGHAISYLPQKKKGQPLSQDGWLFFFVSYCRGGCVTLKEAGLTSSACAPGQGQKVVKNLAGRRRTRTPNGLRAMSSIVLMPCRVANMTGCWLSAIRSTANAQPLCSMYKLPITKAMAANPAANNANAASSSHTKYTCSETITARNITSTFGSCPWSSSFLVPQPT